MNGKLDWINWYGVFCGAALALTVPLILFQIYKSHHDNQRTNAAQYDIAPASDTFRSCEGKAGSELLVCLAKMQEADREDRERQYDLEAQQDMAEAAWLVVGLSLVGVIISGIGIRAIYTTLHEQREQFAAERRPWLGVLKAGVDPDDPFRKTGGALFGNLTVRLRNFGSSPAVHVEVHAQLVMGLEPDVWRQVRDALLVRAEKRPIDIVAATVFPARKFESAAGGVVPMDRLAECAVESNIFFKNPRPNPRFTRTILVLVGVARYEAPHSPKVYKTAFVYSIRRGGTGSFWFDPTDNEEGQGGMSGITVHPINEGWGAT